MRNPQKFRAITLTALSAAIALSGCSTPTGFREPGKIEIPSSPLTPDQLVIPSDHGEISIGEGRASESEEYGFYMRAMEEPGNVALPDFYIDDLSVTESGLKDALQMILDEVNVTLDIEGGPRALERNGPISFVRLRGSLSTVIDRLASSMGFFWRFDGKTVTVEPDRAFVIELPPAVADDSFAGMSNTIAFLGAKDVMLDRVMRTLSFRANAKGLEKITKYMDKVRATRSMLVYNLQIYQVDLNDAGENGIEWNRLGGSNLSRPKAVSATNPLIAAATGGSVSASDLATAAALTRSGAGLGAVIAGPYFNIDAFMAFLKTQGKVKTVSQPRLALLNGGKGMLRVGQTKTFVSKVGSNLGSGISQVTVETRDLRTGVELSLAGDESDRTIYTRIKLILSDLRPFDKFTALGTDLNLPTVDDREMETGIRLPAGYTALLGGININRESDQKDVGLGTNFRSSKVERSELVIVIQPTIVRFNGKKNPAPEASIAARDGMLISPQPAAASAGPDTPTQATTPSGADQQNDKVEG